MSKIYDVAHVPYFWARARKSFVFFFFFVIVDVLDRNSIRFEIDSRVLLRSVTEKMKTLLRAVVFIAFRWIWEATRSEKAKKYSY